MTRTILLLALLTLVSCSGNKEKKERELFIQDSIRVEKEKAESERIAKEQARINSLSLIAWGDAQFRMSLNDAKKTEAFKEASAYSNKNNPYQTLNLYSSETKIDGLGGIEATFFNDRLYLIEIEGYTKTANYYDTDIKDLVMRLKSLIGEKYGQPKTNYGFPDFFEMKPDRRTLAYRWEIGAKTISIYVGEVYSGSQYKVTCDIIHSEEVKAPSEYNRKIREEREKDKKNNF